jgi:hypothetical protein
VFRGDDCYGEVVLKNIHRSHIAELAQKMWLTDKVVF